MMFPPIELAWLGPTVTLVRRLSDGRTTREPMPAAIAVWEALNGAQNGITVLGARVEFGPHLDRWGGSA